MRAEADQARLFAIMFAAQLADVQFLANAAHFGKPRIADMAVVRPDDGFGLRSLCSKQQFERFEHMRIAQIPAFRRAMIPPPILSLGIGAKAAVLVVVKEFLLILSGIITAVGE